MAEIKFGKMNHNVHPLRRQGDGYIEIMDYTDKPAADGIGKTLAYERIFLMTFKEIAALTTAVVVPIALVLLK